MQSPATISHLSIVPQPAQATVKPLITQEEKNFLDLVADIIAKDLLKQTAETPPSQLSTQ